MQNIDLFYHAEKTKGATIIARLEYILGWALTAK